MFTVDLRIIEPQPVLRVLTLAQLIDVLNHHVLLVRVRGVSHPLPEYRVSARAAREAPAAASIAGGIPVSL